jgi:hypothetical protein
MSPVISYTLRYFHDFIVAHPTWEEFAKFITSDAGGNLFITDEERYAIIYYDKKITNMDLPYVRWFRSVIWDKTTHRPVCIAPPKAMKEEPYSWPAVETSEKYVCQEYLEGVNLNLFVSAKEEGQPLHISSRTRLNASGSFYTKRTFTELLEDALESKGQGRNKECLRDALGKDENEQTISKFASIILQHPSHRVVEAIENPNLWRIHYGYVAENGMVTICEDAADIPQIALPNNANPTASVMNWFMEISSTKKWSWQGMVIKDVHGHRWRIRPVIYKMIRSMRGATHRDDERFFSLRAKGLVETYLAYYPEDRALYNIYEKWVLELINKLYELYCKVHKEHSMKMAEIDKCYHVHLNTIQNTYMKQSVKPGEKRHTVKKADVSQYVSLLPAPRLIFLLNMDKRRDIIEDYHVADADMNNV